MNRRLTDRNSDGLSKMDIGGFATATSYLRQFGRAGGRGWFCRAARGPGELLEAGSGERAEAA
jgi:hypothetical protein